MSDDVQPQAPRPRQPAWVPVLIVFSVMIVAIVGVSALLSFKTSNDLFSAPAQTVGPPPPPPPTPKPLPSFDNVYLNPDTTEGQSQQEFASEVEQALPPGFEQLTDEVMKGVDAKTVGVVAYNKTAKNASAASEEVAANIGDSATVNGPFCEDFTGITTISPGYGGIFATGTNEKTQMCVLSVTYKDGNRLQIVTYSASGKVLNPGDGDQPTQAGRFPEYGMAGVVIPPNGVIMIAADPDEKVTPVIPESTPSPGATIYYEGPDGMPVPSIVPGGPASEGATTESSEPEAIPSPEATPSPAP